MILIPIPCNTNINRTEYCLRESQHTAQISILVGNRTLKYSDQQALPNFESVSPVFTLQKYIIFVFLKNVYLQLTTRPGKVNEV